jgi:Domain of unknown function (DUF4407)
MSSLPPVSDDDVPGGPDPDASDPADGTGVAAGQSEPADTPDEDSVVDDAASPPSPPDPPDFALREPVTLDDVLAYVGASRTLPEPAHQFPPAKLGPAGRVLLRIVGVDITAVPDGEQWRLYGLAATVLLNAGLAAVFVPVGAIVAYGSLSRTAVLVSAALGFFTIGIIDALVVGQWHSYAKHFTKINPDAPIPRMPGTGARCAVLAPRLLVTAGLVFTLGLLLTLAMNRQAVRQEMGTLDAQHNSATRTSLLAPDNATIATATALITKDSAARTADLASATRYQKLASCESLGFPAVPGCSGHVGFGNLWRTYTDDAKAADADAAAQQQDINTEDTIISQAQANKSTVQNSPQYQQAMIPSTGIIAATSAYDAYIAARHIPWYDAWRMEILLAFLDLTPLLIKLGSGTTQYESELWWRAHRRAILAYQEDEVWKGDLGAIAALRLGAAVRWAELGVKRAEWLVSHGPGRPARPAGIHPVSPQAILAPAVPGEPGPAPAAAPRLDPFNLRRNAELGDIIHLADGDYILLIRLTQQESRNADVFIGVEVPKPGQTRPNARNRNPVRAVKLTKLDDGGRVIAMSAAETALLDSFPVDPALLEPHSLTESHDGRTAYTMHYHPRGDLERYVYGGGRDRPRLTNAQAVDVGLTLVRGLQKLWDMDLVHNDARLRNILFTGPLADNGELSMLVPGQHDRAVLTDYNFIGRLGGTYHDPPGLVVNALESDPALVRWMLAHADDDGLSSPLGLASDCYAAFAVVYALLSGGLSPTAALLLSHGWNREALQQFDSPDSVQTWRDMLAGQPDLLLADPPSLLGFGVPEPLALAVDAGVRADQALRQPQIAGAGDISPAAARGYVEHELSRARDRSSHRWLRQPIPKIHDDHPWRGLIEAPVGFPAEVIDYLRAKWPAFVQGGAS